MSERPDDDKAKAVQLDELASRHSRRGAVRKALRLLVRFVAVPHEVIRSLRSPDIARGYPRYSSWLRWLAAAEVLILAVLAIVEPRLLILLLAFIALGSAWFWWQARPNRGRKRGWPPGSTGVGSQAMSDPNFYFKGWESHGRVFKANLFDQPIVCVVGVRETAELLHEHGDSLGSTVMAWNRFIPGGLTRWMRGELHEHYRHLLAGSLGARLIRANKELIVREVDRTFTLMAAEGTDRNGVAPLPHIQDLVFGIWAGFFFGVPRGGESFGALQAAFDIVSIEKQAPASVVRPALAEIQDIVTAGFVGFPNEVGDDSLRDSLLGEVIRRDGETLSNPVTMANLVYLMETTSKDVTGLLMWLLKHAGEHPRLLDRVRVEGSSAEPLALVNRMVAESVRLEQSEYLHRRATQDFRFRGVVIPKGWLVHVCIHESHRDPEIFEEPDVYNPDRFLESSYSADYAPFGIGDRACVGVPLTREISRSLLLRLSDRYEMGIVEDGPRELSAQRHWAPNSRLRLMLNARAVN